MRVDPGWFDRRYAAEGDPWDFAGSAYEQRRYDLTMAVLPRARYRHCVEPACATGELTARLATRCDLVSAFDGSPTVVAMAADRLAGLANVELTTASLPEHWPDASADLVVFSELGYYFDAATWTGIIERAARGIEPGGTVLAVHWLGHSPDHPRHGEEVHDDLAAVLGPPDGAYRQPELRLDWWHR